MDPRHHLAHLVVHLQGLELVSRHLHLARLHLQARRRIPRNNSDRMHSLTLAWCLCGPSTRALAHPHCKLGVGIRVSLD